MNDRQWKGVRARGWGDTERWPATAAGEDKKPSRRGCGWEGAVGARAPQEYDGAVRAGVAGATRAALSAPQAHLLAPRSVWHLELDLEALLPCSLRCGPSAARLYAP